MAGSLGLPLCDISLDVQCSARDSRLQNGKPRMLKKWYRVSLDLIETRNVSRQLNKSLADEIDCMLATRLHDQMPGRW